MSKKPLKFVAPPSDVPEVSWQLLQAGDCILQHGEVWYSGLIQDVCDSPWSHAAMVVKEPDSKRIFVAEMTKPKLRMTPLATWLAGEGGVYTCRLAGALSIVQARDVWYWWWDKLGRPYDYGLLLGQLLPAWWQRWSVHLHIPWRYRFLPALSIWGVCSTSVAEAYKAAGLQVDEGGTSTITPADLPRQPFLRPLEIVHL